MILGEIFGTKPTPVCRDKVQEKSLVRGLVFGCVNGWVRERFGER